MSNLLQAVTPDELARKCGLRAAGRDDSCASNEEEPAPWGIADAIRREVRRRSIATRRELRANIMPILEAAGFTTEAWTHIRRVADEMVDIGELVDLRVDHQRGYAARPSRWVQTAEASAAILGVTATNQLPLTPNHPLQHVRRFDPQDVYIVESLARMGVHEEAFDRWYGEPNWYDWLTVDPMPATLSSLWSYQVGELQHKGAKFEPDETAIQTVAPRPSDFFQWPPKAGSGRWQSPADLSDGVYLAAQPGHHDRHWLPLLIELSDGTGRSLLLKTGSDQDAHWELFRWLLVARGTAYPEREQIQANRESGLMKLTFPVPKQMQRCLSLCGEYLGKWRYQFHNISGTLDTLAVKFDAIRWIH